ncbi:unnamed protein product [Allacma fusca]|uniref:Uncharacterized protein n=1 Tax=Allacma fusca TaxID=39272 RepID=A0A8J2KEA8_9HEXA|nr:unnamed protein product [Allacma fusca]
MQTKYPGVYRQVENELRSNFNPDGIHLENLLDEPFANIDPERTVMCSPSTCNVSSCGHLRNLRNLLVKDEISTVPNSDIRDLENPYSWMDPNKFESVKCICKCIANADQDEDFRRDQVPEVPVESIHPQSDPPNQKV